MMIASILLGIMTALTSSKEYIYSMPLMTNFTGDVNRPSRVLHREDLAWLTEAGQEYWIPYYSWSNPESTNYNKNVHYDDLPIKSYNIGYYPDGRYRSGAKSVIYKRAYDNTNNVAFYIRGDIKPSSRSFIMPSISTEEIRKGLFDHILGTREPWLNVSTNFPANRRQPIKKEYITSAFEDTKQFKKFVVWDYPSISTYPASGSITYRDREIVVQYDEKDEKPEERRDINKDSQNGSAGVDYTFYFYASWSAYDSKYNGYKDEKITTFNSYDYNFKIIGNHSNDPCITIFGRDGYYKKAFFDSEPRVSCDAIYGIFKASWSQDDTSSTRDETIVNHHQGTNGYVVIKLEATPMGSWRGTLSGDTNKYFRCGWKLNLSYPETPKAVMRVMGASHINDYDSVFAPDIDTPNPGSEYGDYGSARTSVKHNVKLIGYIGIFNMDFHAKLPDE